MPTVRRLSIITSQSMNSVSKVFILNSLCARRRCTTSQATNPTTEKKIIKHKIIFIYNYREICLLFFSKKRIPAYIYK